MQLGLQLVAQCILDGEIANFANFFSNPQKSQDHTVNGGQYTPKVLSKPYFTLSWKVIFRVDGMAKAKESRDTREKDKKNFARSRISRRPLRRFC